MLSEIKLLATIMMACGGMGHTLFSAHTSNIKRELHHISLTLHEKETERALRKVKESVLRSMVGRWGMDVEEAAIKTKTSPFLIAAVLKQENYGNIENAGRAVSGAGAVGPMQLMPATATYTLHVNPWVPSQNIRGGAAYIRSLISTFHGDVFKALVAYNEGPQLVKNGVEYSGSVAYAREIMRRYKSNTVRYVFDSAVSAL
jgi:soluble lytic murein transglycosylase-like protein